MRSLQKSRTPSPRRRLLALRRLLNPGTRASELSRLRPERRASRAKHAGRPPAPRLSCGARSRCLARRERVLIGLAACAQSSPILHIAGAITRASTVAAFRSTRTPHRRHSLPPWRYRRLLHRRIAPTVPGTGIALTTSHGVRPTRGSIPTRSSVLAATEVPRSRWRRWSARHCGSVLITRAIRGRSGDKLGCHHRLLRRSTKLTRRARGLIGRGPASGRERSAAAGRALVESPSSSSSTGPGRPIAKPWA
jgi:hypothetical protein